MSNRARTASAVTHQLPIVELSSLGAAQPPQHVDVPRAAVPPRVGLPPRQGLYDPANEHDACGVGMVVDIAGRKTHQIVRSAIEILENLTHRGACGCDPETGDGAGILTQMPHELFRRVSEGLGFGLPSPGDYGVAVVFLPREADQRDVCERQLEAIIAEEGQRVLGWRDVPVDQMKIGRVAREAEPVVRQLFVARGADTPRELLDWKLYVIRKRVERAIAESDLAQKTFFYIPSFSSRVIIYKGLLLAEQVDRFYNDLADPDYVSALALVHQRYSTNTFPTWDLAQPFRYLCHNGEINTLRGNVNWMHARESMLAHPQFGPDLAKIMPICTPGASDSANFDNALELLVITGRPLAQAMSMLIPEPWAGHESMSDEKKAYYEYQSCLMEPWDGPASMAFTDGTLIGAVLDRNGLRPSRYWVTKDGLLVMGSESGVLQIPQKDVAYKGRLQPGRMLLVDTAKGEIIADDELKHQLASRQPYRQWLDENLVRLDDLPAVEAPAAKPTVHSQAALGLGVVPQHRNGHRRNGSNGSAGEPLVKLERVFGYTLEDLRIILAPMALDGYEPIGSMGNDTPLAVLSDRPQLLYNYFKQLFAQVTNPPLDAIREEIVTSLITTIGAEGNLLAETPEQCALLRLEQPIITNAELAKIRALDRPRLKSRTLSMLFKRSEGAAGLERRLQELRAEASRAVADGITILILSDRGVNAELVPIPALLATSSVHHHLIREMARTRCGLVVETGEAREVQHFALLTGYGAGAVNPYLAFEVLAAMQAERYLPADEPVERLEKNFVKAVGKGLLKVGSKMGISTQQSYRGAQIFEAIGLNSALVDEHFTRTASRIEGIGLAEIAEESLRRHEHAYPTVEVPELLALDVGGQYQWRRKGEAHIMNPDVVSKLQQATRLNSREEFRRYQQLIDQQERQLLTLRGLLNFRELGHAIPVDQVEPAKEIVKRFATGAMSYGSISKEAHEMLAVAMNRMGAKSNTGEGGEDPARYQLDANGDSRNSAIKQVASARFGVTSYYLVNAKELQIKMAQGAKPGEGGQLPGHKVDKEIGRIRHSTPGVTLISPPPHHDIYSIEDLAQLIHDLKNSNRDARVSVKLVAEVGVGTVAAGVAKGKADVVLISGHDGGTGASPQTSIKHAGIPWELGLAETQQVLVMNDLRGRIIVQTDGMLRTAKDVAIATLLGAEEWGIATASLVVLGCIMMRKCHLNTCPVGIATQDPALRAKFEGKPEWVVNYFFMLAEELREIMARLGFRTINEMVGRVDRLDTREAIAHWKARGLDFTNILRRPPEADIYKNFCDDKQDHGIDRSLDVTDLLPACAPALERGEKVVVERHVRNIQRTVGTILSSEVTKKYGPKGLPADTIELNFRGTAGQSLLAFGAPGITVRLEGDVNDYCGKGLSGGKIIVYPDRDASFKAEDNIICGNVALYGATSGELYLRGIAGERFCVRNSGARAVVEGVGDHGCEYMTGGIVLILGAFVLDEHGKFPALVNRELVELEEIADLADQTRVLEMLRNHVRYTGSTRGQYVLDNWDTLKSKFVKVMPIDYKRAIAEMLRERHDDKQEDKDEAEAAGTLEEVARG
jgi:glutamate synthase domain-containing protein 2/glutamate synthase domain-containing protein 1/glutamate synthase domain-containing protein 3